MLIFALSIKLIPSEESPLPATGNIISPIGPDEIIPSSKKRTLFFICEPIIAGFCIFPLLIIFWQAGWNFLVEWLDTPLGQHQAVLPSLYVLSQLLLLFIYINQDRLYNFLVKQQSKFFSCFILQCHSLIKALNYTVQWVAIWTLLDQHTTTDFLIMLLISIIAILAIIVLTGHPCDLVVAPFVISYDAVEYNVRIGTPFVTEKMNQFVSHVLNYFFYEHIISMLTILAWRGSYALLDVYLYPNDENMSAGISLLLGYSSFFLFMYTQSFSNDICLIPKFINANYPSFIQNLRHLGAFFSCILLWRGFWILFDKYIATISLAVASPYVFYLVCIILSFVIMSMMKTGSSINGPMSHMNDEYDLFPLYPNCFLVKWFDGKIASDDISSNTSEITNLEPLEIAVI